MCPFCPPGFLLERSRRLLTRAGFFSPSLDGGLPLFELFNPSRRSSSAIRAFREAFSAFRDAFSARSAAISATRSSVDSTLGVSRIIRFLNRKLPTPSREIYRSLSRSPNLGSNVQQDILETFIDRGRSTPTGGTDHVSDGKAHASMSLITCGNALRDALVSFALCGRQRLSHRRKHSVVKALNALPIAISLGSLRYDLSKLRAKGLVTKLPNSRRYQLLPHGYSICLVFLKLFERIYTPLVAGLLSPVSHQRLMLEIDQQNRSQLDRLYQRVVG